VLPNASRRCRVIFSTSEPHIPPAYPRWREIAEGARSYLSGRESPTLLDSWLAAGSDRRPPARGDLLPESMARILSDIWLMDYEPQEGRLRYRLVGENIRARYDFPLVGKCLDEILAPEARERVLGYFRACVEQPAVSIVAGRLYHEWERPGYGVGITICRQTFPSRPVAEIRAKRVTSILPLDGSPASEDGG